MVFYFVSISFFLDFPFCTLTLINEVNFLFTVLSCLVIYISDDGDAKIIAQAIILSALSIPLKFNSRADAEASVYCADVDNMLA